MQHDEKRRQCDQLRGELDQLELSKNLLQERESKLSVNMLRLSVEEQRQKEAEAQVTTRTEKLVLDAYLQVIEVSEGVTQGLKVIAENVRPFPSSLLPLKQSLETATQELSKGFSAKRESRQPLLKTSSTTSSIRRRSEFFLSFPTEVEVDREKATDFFFTSVKPYLSLSSKEVISTYLRIFPDNLPEAEEFAYTVSQNPIICLCLSAKDIENYLQKCSKEHALIEAKNRLPKLIIKSHGVLTRNITDLSVQFIPVLAALQSHVTSDYTEMLDFCREKLPTRTIDVEECIKQQEKRSSKYTNQQKDRIIKKIGMLVSNQRGAKEPFVMENKYIVEENVLRPGVKPKPKVEVVDERSETVRCR